MDFDKILSSDNLAKELDEDTLAEIGNTVCEDYDTDKSSMEGWLERHTEALKLALQVQESKSFPWRGASNVRYPLITIAATQFNARAYPALIPGPEVVKHRVIGPDREGEKVARATRLATHMNYTLTGRDEEWTEGMDRLLMMLPVVGCIFRKVYYDPLTRKNRQDLITPQNLVLDYYTKDIKTARRVSHVIQLTENEIVERERAGIFIECDLTDPVEFRDDPVQGASDEATGRQQPSLGERPYTIIEQHRWWDLDDDGYQEPYIVTVIEDLKKVVRIRKRFKKVERVDPNDSNSDIRRIEPETYFIKYGFLPSPDGGILDIGFGTLLGAVSHAVDTLINQLVDAGTLANTQGGFLGRGIRVKGGRLRFTPGEWKPVESPGQDLKNNIVPLPIKEPSNVLFSLLGLLIESGQGISSVSDQMMGKDPGQNTAATTSMAVLEQGLQVFSGIFKRVYRSMDAEIRRLYELNGRFGDAAEYEQITESDTFRKDYRGDPTDIAPSADPRNITQAQKLLKAQAMVERTATLPHIYGLQGQLEAEKRFLRALQIEDVDRILPEEVQPPVNEELEFEKQKHEQEMQIKAFDSEMNARRTMSNVQKDRANTIRTFATIENDEEKTAIEKLRVLLDAEEASAEKQIEAAKVLIEGEKAKREGTNESGTA